MKVYYKDIALESVAVEYSTSFTELDCDYNNLTFSGILGSFKELYRLKGELKFTFSSSCDRCLDSVTVDIAESIEQLLSPTVEYIEQQSEDGLTDDEVDVYITDSEYFDLASYLHEEAILLTPFKRLCKDGCKGICDSCGSNLNIEACSCKDSVVDSRWSKLVDLK